MIEISPENRRFLSALAEAGYVVVPRQPTGAMQAAVYYAGGVGDSGGREDPDFTEEWDAAIKQWTEGGDAPSGLLALVRPVTWEDDDELEAERQALYPSTARQKPAPSHERAGSGRQSPVA